MTYEEWERLQDEREREARKTDAERMMEEVPDWFQQMDSRPPTVPPQAQPSDAGSVPDWFLGLEEQSPEDAPDWFQQFDPSADPLSLPPEPSSEKPPAEEPPASNLPDWLRAPEVPGMEDMDWAAAFGAPPTPAPAPAPAEPEPVAEAEVPPGEAPGWLADAAPPMETPEPEEAPLDLEAMFDLGEEFQTGMVSDWMANATPPEEPSEPEAAPEPEEALPLPGMGDLTGEEEPFWLTQTPADARARPEEVSFPDIDLDQTMPTEAAFGAALEAAGEPSEAAAEDFAWMDEVAPSGEPSLEPPDDFVERFEPFEPEEYEEGAAPVLAPIDEEAPAWLRELAGEAVDEAMSEDLFGAPPEEPSLAPAESAPEAEALDWLGELSPEDVAREAAQEMPPEPDARIPELEEGVLPTGPLDSHAIDQLLGLLDTTRAAQAAEEEPEPAEAVEDLETMFDEAALVSSGTREIEPAEPGEAVGLEAEAPAFEEAGDLEALFAEGVPAESMDDLAAMFDEVALTPAESMEALFDEAAPGEVAPAEAERALPEAPPQFRRPPEPAPEPAPLEEALTATEHPEWLAEMRPSDLPVAVKAGGAEISIKQKQVVELPERLRAFRESALRDLGEPAKLAPAGAGPLAGIEGALPVPDLALPKGAAARPMEGLVITPEQQARVARLQAMLELTAAEEEEIGEEKAPAFDFSFAEEGAEPRAEEKPAPARRARRKPDRVIVGLLLLVALVVPFLTDALYLGSNPPPLEDERLAVAEAVDTVGQGDYVLFAFEYAPTAAGELDLLAEAVLRDTLARGAIPLTISTNPAGAFHAASVLAALDDDPALLAARGQGEAKLTPGEDYVALRFLSGEAVGIRSLRSTRANDDGTLKQHPAFKTDLRGDDTGLPIGSLARDIALIVVVGEDSGAIRNWAEQLDEVAAPKVALVTAAIEPLTAPYVRAGAYVGYLAGVRDTYSYNAARNANNQTPFEMPDDLKDLPNPDEARWHSMALGAAMAALLITVGMIVNLLRGMRRRRRA
jgi:hypothetical protein